MTEDEAVKIIEAVKSEATPLAGVDGCMETPPLNEEQAKAYAFGTPIDPASLVGQRIRFLYVGDITPYTRRHESAFYEISGGGKVFTQRYAKRGL
jgi:hypothetical protein